MSRRAFLPRIVKIEGVVYEIHQGTPGHPVIYRRSEGKSGPLHRVADDDPIVDTIAMFMQAEREQKQAARNP